MPTEGPTDPEDHEGMLLRREFLDANAEINRQAARRAHDQSDEWRGKLIEAATRDAQEAMKVGLVINGGAAIAVLAFIGSLGSKSGVALADLKPVIKALFWFTGGVLSSAITAACGYFANSFYSGSHAATAKTWEHPYLIETALSKSRGQWGKGFNIAGIVFAVVALLLFVVGVFAAAKGVSRLVSH